MRLCGLDIPYENQFLEKTTANRVHSFAIEAGNVTQVLSYDNSDIAGVLRSTKQAIKGILKAVDQGKFFDEKGYWIHPSIVKEELNVLSEDCEKIATVVKGILNSQAGKERWPLTELALSSRKEFFISIPAELENLQSLSRVLKDVAETIQDSPPSV